MSPTIPLQQPSAHLRQASTHLEHTSPHLQETHERHQTGSLRLATTAQEDEEGDVTPDLLSLPPMAQPTNLSTGASQ